MKTYKLKLLYFYFLLIIVQQKANSQISSFANDSLLSEMQLSPKEFVLLTYSQAYEKYYKSKPYNHEGINPNDTIILPRSFVFNNTLIISKANIPFVLDLSQCTFKKGLSIESSKFNNDLFLFNCVFEKGISFGSTKFNASIILHNSLIEEYFSLTDDTVKSLMVYNNKINGDFNCWGSIFNDYTFFGGNKFLKHSTFIESKFDKLVLFKGNDFAEDLSFISSIFYDTIIFHSTVHKDLDFFDARIDRLFDISYSKVDGKIYLGGSIMPIWIDISGLKLIYEIDFTAISDSLNKEYKINLFNTDINKILLPNNFDLFFDPSLTIDQRNVVYKNVLETLDSKGYKNGHKLLDIKYRHFVNIHYNNKIETLIYWINKMWWNFGYDKSKIFKNTALLIFAFSILVFIWLSSFVSEVYNFVNLSARLEINKLKRNRPTRLISNYFVALLFTVFIFFNLKLDFDKLSFNNFLKGGFVLLIYGTGLVCSVFIVNYIFTS